MILELSVVLAAVLAEGRQDDRPIFTSHDASPVYHRYDYQAACGSTVLRVRFQNGPDRQGRVEHLMIDGRRIQGAAEHLQLLAARRPIERIGIMHCGNDERRPIFRGVMDLSEAASRVDKLRPSLYFRLRKQADGRWRMFMD